MFFKTVEAAWQCSSISVATTSSVIERKEISICYNQTTVELKLLLLKTTENETFTVENFQV